MSAPTRFVSTPTTASTLRPTRAVQTGPDHTDWRRAVLSAPILTSPTSSIGSPSKPSDRELSARSNDLAASHASTTDSPKTAAPNKYLQESATVLSRNQLPAGEPNLNNSTRPSSAVTELRRNESSVPFGTAPMVNTKGNTTGKSNSTSHVDDRNAAASDSVDLTATLLPVATPTQVVIDFSIRVSGRTTDATTETISALDVSPEQKQFAPSNLFNTNTALAHSVSTSPAKVQTSSVDVADQVVSSPLSAGSSERESATTTESTGTLSDKAVTSDAFPEVAGKPVTISSIQIAGSSRVSQPAPGPEQKQFAPSNFVTTNNEHAHPASTSPAKVQTISVDVAGEVASIPLSAGSNERASATATEPTAILSDKSITLNASSEVAGKQRQTLSSRLPALRGSVSPHPA